MKELTLNEIKDVELSILSELDKICQENDLRYWLTAGTLLGAIRHKGFIPWDDDIDILMPRKDYMLLIDFFKHNQTSINLISHESNDDYYRLFAKACDNSTLIIDNQVDVNNYNAGVWVDIFPIDGLGDDYKQATKIFKKTKFKRSVLIASIWKHFFRSKTKSIIYEPIRFFFYIIAKFSNKKKLIQKIEKHYINIDFDSSKYCGCVCGNYGVIEKKLFDETIDAEFEGKNFKIIKDYDSYLTYLYGDYMKLPPEEKQKTHHDYTAFWKE